MKIFEPYQVAKILQYVSSSYVETFSLYKYIFLNKKKNEEIRLNVYVDQPLISQPLSEALYMGYDYQPIVDPSDQEDEYRETMKILQYKTSMSRLESQHTLNRDMSGQVGMQQGKDGSDGNNEFEMQTIDDAFRTFKDGVDEQLGEIENEVEALVEDMENPKKKKK